jgi:hypothetical protein
LSDCTIDCTATNNYWTTLKYDECYAILHGVFYDPKTSHINFQISQNWWELLYFEQCSQFTTYFPLSQKLSNKGKRKHWKITQEKKWTTLELSLHFDSANHKLSFNFPPKMMSCKLNHNLICLDHGPSSKDLGTNLELLTNRNPQFHWTTLFEPLSKVALNVMPFTPMERFFYVLTHFSIIHHCLSQNL